MRVYKTTPEQRSSSVATRERIKSDPLLLDKKRQYQRAYVTKYRDRINVQARNKARERSVEIRLLRKGLSIDLVKHVESHSGKCDICGGEPDGRWKTLAIDHNHETGAYRGMLCTNCNRGIGHFKENEETMRRAITYLRHSQLNHELKGFHAAGISFMPSITKRQFRDQVEWERNLQRSEIPSAV